MATLGSAESAPARHSSCKHGSALAQTHSSLFTLNSSLSKILLSRLSSLVFQSRMAILGSAESAHIAFGELPIARHSQINLSLRSLTRSVALGDFGPSPQAGGDGGGLLILHLLRGRVSRP